MAHPGDDTVLGPGAADLAAASLSLARRLAAGGTLWCWSPGASHHAQHVAVEFVHPVVMGARALPAVAVLDDDGAGALRPLAAAGDVLLAISGADAEVSGTLRRAAAWGLTTLWMGNGPTPLGAVVDHLLWRSDDPAAALDGRLVLGYHLLWELTQVCFEHPGLVDIRADEGPGCTTCADEGRLGEVVESAALDATVRTATGVERVSTMMVGPVGPGDLVLVHAGTAITVVDA